MICKTDGIVLHSLKYSESSLIVRIFTREAGMQSYLVRGVRRQKSKTKQLLFQPLTLVSMVAYHKQTGKLQGIREISLLKAYRSIPANIEKTTIAIFLAEVLSHALKNQEASSRLFEFLHDALIQLDQSNERLAAFHLVFLLQLSRHLGFVPLNNHSDHLCFFNLREGVFQHMFEKDGQCLDKELSHIFFQVAQTELMQHASLVFPAGQRRALLNKIIDYYRWHVAGMPEVKGHKVLEAVFTG